MNERKYVGRFLVVLFLAVFLAFMPAGPAGAAPASVGDDRPVCEALGNGSEETPGTEEDPEADGSVKTARDTEITGAEEESEETEEAGEESGEGRETAESGEDIGDGSDASSESGSLPEKGPEENVGIGWRQSAEARGIYDFTRGLWMVGTYYLGENLEEILRMSEDPKLPDFDLDTYFRHTVFAGTTRELLEQWRAEGFLSPEEVIPYMPMAARGEANPVASVKDYSSAVGTSEAFHIQSYPMNGDYGVCVQKGAPIRSGCVYTKIAESEEDSFFYCRETERILGYGADQQKAMSRLLSLIDNPDREAAFPGLPESYWIFFAQAGSWSLLDPDKGAACVESRACFVAEVSGLLRWADFVNDDVDWIADGRDWGSVECINEILDWLEAWTKENGYARLYWYYVPGTEYQAVCVPDLRRRMRETGYLELTKSGEHTGAKANMDGTVYGIYRDEACTEEVGSVTTNENGYGKSGAVPAGAYFIHETKAASGVCLNPAVYPVEIRPGETACLNDRYPVTDEEWQGEIQLKKFSPDKEALAGAVFTLYEYSSRDDAYHAVEELTDRGDGTYVSQVLYYTSDNRGRFRVEETKAPAGYLNGGWEQDFVLTGERETFVRAVENAPTRYRFLKTDSSGAAVAGCRFRLLDESGEVVAEWVTDESGSYEMVGRIEAGKRYTLQETEAPVGYRLADERIFIAEASEEVQTIVSENSEIPGIVRVRKADERDQSLPGAVFGLYSTFKTEGNRLVWEGKTYYYQTRKTTGADGYAVFDGLRTTRGESYLLVEFSTVSGYERIGKPVYVGVLPEMSVQKPEASYTGEVQEKNGEYYLYERSYTVVNRPGYTLPLAGEIPGSVRRPAVWMAGAAALACAWAEENRRRKGE